MCACVLMISVASGMFLMITAAMVTIMIMTAWYPSNGSNAAHSAAADEDDCRRRRRRCRRVFRRHCQDRCRSSSVPSSSSQTSSASRF